MIRNSKEYSSRLNAPTAVLSLAKARSYSDLSMSPRGVKESHTVPVPVSSGEQVLLDFRLREGPVSLLLQCAALREISPALDENRGYSFGLIMGTRTRTHMAIDGWRLLTIPQETIAPAQSQAAVLQMLRVESASPAGESRPLGLFRTQPGGWPVITELDSHWIDA